MRYKFFQTQALILGFLIVSKPGSLLADCQCICHFKNEEFQDERRNYTRVECQANKDTCDTQCHLDIKEINDENREGPNGPDRITYLRSECVHGKGECRD